MSPSAPGTGAYALNALGYTSFPQGSAGIQDAEYAIDLAAVTTTTGGVAFTFLDNTNEGTSNEFYGIDNVAVTSTAVSAAPEPSAWLLLFAGIGGIGLALRRARKTVSFGFKGAFSA